LRLYQRPELLVIDEFGFDRVERLESPQAAHLLYKVIVARHRRRSTALITNIDFDGWADYMTDGPLAMAFLDRLVEGAIIVKITGRSYRARKAKTGKPFQWIRARPDFNRESARARSLHAPPCSRYQPQPWLHLRRRNGPVFCRRRHFISRGYLLPLR